MSFLQTEVRQIYISTAGAMLFVVGENVSIVLSCLVPACCGHPVERMMRREGRYRWSRGTRRNWGSHDPGSPWSCHTQQPWSSPLRTPGYSRLHQLCRIEYDDRSNTENTPVLSLYSAATISQSEAGGVWLMVRPGNLTNGSRDTIFSSGPVNSVIVLKC